MNAIDLSDFFKTKSEATDFSTRLSAISYKIYQTDFNLEKALMSQFGLQRKEKFLTLLRDNNIDVQSNAALRDFFGKIQAQISSLPVLNITLAFEPDQHVLKALSEWFVLNINKQVLFEISVDASLIAGVTIRYNGRFLDCSIKAKFDKILEEFIKDTFHITKEPAPLEGGHLNINHISIGR